MKMNKQMSALLGENDVRLPLADALGNESVSFAFDIADGSVLLAKEHQRTKHLTSTDFPDKTGYECFVNHVHFPFDGTRESLISCLRRAFELKHNLARFEGRKFQIIISVTNDECTSRFHEIRPDESWLAPNLEGYASEAILVLESTD